MKAIATQLAAIVSPEEVCEWDSIDAMRQAQIKRALWQKPDLGVAQSVSSTAPSCIVYPHTQAELAAVLTCANDNNWRVLPYGSGSKLSWGGLVKDVQVLVSTERLNQVIQHAIGDLTITVEAGTKFADIQKTLAQVGQFLALDPTAPESATIGGIVATADTNSLRQRYGSVRDQLLGISFIRADGQIAKAGGRVVKNVAGYDLMKLFTGSYGTLGAIAQVTFRVYPLPKASGTVVLTGEAEAIAKATAILRASALTPTKADLLSTQLVTNLGIGEGLGLVTCFQSLSESVKEQSTRLVEVGQKLGLQSAIYSAQDAADLWQKLPAQMHNSTIDQTVTCKIGVLPSAAVATLNQLDSVAPQQGLGLIHAGSGLGLLRFDSPTIKINTILKMRTHCQTHGGFLTVLEAPVTFKQQLDVWGYRGNALDLIRRIKQQFDPKNILSPHRFVSGI
jgi:glycolate oxidase FAD binding subunit